MNTSLSVRYRREFLGVTLFFAILTTLITYLFPAYSVDRFLYDTSLNFTHQRPANEDIVIIAIDDQSLHQLGTWPWRRVLHAQLLRQLDDAKAVGYDISFLGPSYHPEDDKELAQAIKNHGRVVLASFFNEKHPPSLPDPILLSEANQTGFINILIENDGLVRKLDRWEGDASDITYHFSLAMLLAGGMSPKEIDRIKIPSRVSIPYAGPPNHYKTVSYTDVLNLRLPEDIFKDKYVLIGAWATGLGDAFPTPTSSSTNASGVEIIANALQSELEQHWITEASTGISLFVALFWVLSYCLMLLILSPRNLFIGSAILLTVILGSHFAILKYLDLWIRLDPSLIVIPLIYPIWSWRMQELVLKQMHKEITDLDNEGSLLPIEHGHLVHNHKLPINGLNTFYAHINRLHSAISRVRNLRQFITDSLDGMPYASAIFDYQENFLLATATTEKYFNQLDAPITPQESLNSFIHKIAADDSQSHKILEQIRQWYSRQALYYSETFSQEELEFKDKQNRDILLKFTHTYTSVNSISGFILTFIDLSHIREEERQREQTIHFLSHDMRAPQSAIQALIKIQQNPETALSRENFLQKISHLSQTTLNLVDNFLYLARAKNTSYHLVPINLNDLLQNVIDNFWSIAKSRQISIILSQENPIAYVMADGTLLSRAFNNLIDNAIKYGKDGMKINIDIKEDEGYWEISVSDRGIGIAKEDFSRIFQVFARAPKLEVSKRISGLGLGLAFVHTVINGHQGNITLQSEEDVGTTFFIRLPILHDEESV